MLCPLADSQPRRNHNGLKSLTFLFRPGSQGEIDITGYPKEGAKEGDLGGVISITLYR